RSATACTRRTATISRRSRITRRGPSESSRSSCWSGSRNTRKEAGEEQRMEGPPPQYTAKTLDDYLEHLSKGVFQAGISWRVVDARWPSITKAFHGFAVERVARRLHRNFDRLVQDEGVMPSRPKVGGVVHI